MTDQAVLLINLGSPDSPNTQDVRKYLDEFLMDPYVLDMPYLVRRILLSCVILPKRPVQSAHAYQSIWWPEGSPLKVISERLLRAINEESQLPHYMAMRYGNPSIANKLREIQQQHPDLKKLLVVPLYPQYAMSTSLTSAEKVKKEAQKISFAAQIRWLPQFYQSQAYLDALAQSIAPYLEHEFDHLLFSYHGLPERHLTKTDPTSKHCMKSADCCQKPSEAWSTCYRHQCFSTSQNLIDRLQLDQKLCSISFQSRLGRIPWLRPYTDEHVEQLQSQGIKKLLIACPAFVADCLETLEEIGIGIKEEFLNRDGIRFELIPCLNDQPHWVKAFASITASALDQWQKGESKMNLPELEVLNQ